MLIALSFAYLNLPIVIYLFSWIRFPFNLLNFLLVYTFYKLCRSKLVTMPLNKQKILISHVVYISFILFLYLLMTGHGGFLFTNGVDIPWRNAIYYDLISHSWPVIYEENGTALTYYLTFWLPAAGISSILGLTNSQAQVVLFIWSFIGLLLVCLMLCNEVKANTCKENIISTITFFFWSGMNLIGMILRSAAGKDRPFAIEDAPGFASWQYSSWAHGGYFIGYFIRTTFDSIANVYNQFIPMALCTLLFLRFKKDYRFYAFICLLALPYSPFGFIGLSLLMLGYFLCQLFKSKNRNEILVQVASIENLSALISILPIYGFYYTANAVSVASGNQSIFMAPLHAYTFVRVSNLILFYLLSFGVYLYLIRPKKSDAMLWIAAVLLCIFPFFKIGRGGDFLWNASVAPYFFIMLTVIKHLLTIMRAKKVWGRDLLLIICLCIGMLTPIMQLSSSLRACALHKTHVLYLDPENVNGTFEGKDVIAYRNFLAVHYKNSFFYKYLAKD